MSDKKLSKDFKYWYNKGWTYSSTAKNPTLEQGDRKGYPDAWYNGYLDFAAGRDKWTTTYTRPGHHY